MNTISDIVKKFFDEYEKTSNSIDIEAISSQYADTFMFGDPYGVQSIKKEDFLKMVPKRKGFFTTIGLKSTRLVSLEETKLDDSYIKVKANWIMRFEKDPQTPIDNENSATYILFLQDNSLRIVFQIDHQDLKKKVQALGLL